MEHARIRSLTVVGYAVLAYAAFLVASASAVTFLADRQLPRGIDHGTRQPAGLAVVVDVALLLLFAVRHSVMARSGFKRWVARSIPPHDALMLEGPTSSSTSPSVRVASSARPDREGCPPW